MPDFSDFVNSLAESRAGQFIGDLLSPEEAEASPLGEVVKASKKLLKQESSSAAKSLVGMKIEGKTVVDVKKGVGQWRDIVFDDGTSRSASTKDLEYLCRRKGTKDQLQYFGEKDFMSKRDQALRSLNKRREFSPTIGPVRPGVRSGLTERFQGMEDLGVGTPDYVFVQDLRPGGKYHSIPREYADILEKTGDVKIVQGGAEDKILNKFKGTK